MVKGPVGIYPALSGARGAAKFLSRELVCDTTGLVRFANVQSVRGATCEDEQVRILRGILHFESRKGAKNRETVDWVKWHWEAICRPIYLPSGTIGYSCDAIILKGHSWQEGFIRKRLRIMAKRLHGKSHLALIERIALFMDGCVTALAASHTAIIAEDMAFVPHVEPPAE